MMASAFIAWTAVVTSAYLVFSGPQLEGVNISVPRFMHIRGSSLGLRDRERLTMKKQILLLILMLLPIVASAYDAKINGIYYNFSDNKAEVTYLKYQDNYPYYISDYTGAVVIPASVTYNGKTYTVTGISNYAFYKCSSLSSISIPSSMIVIGEWAFYGCSSLTSVTIPNSVTNIGNNAFYECGLTSVTIPSSVTSIGNNAFRSCSRLTSINISEGLTSIGNDAFYGCSSLTSINIPNSVTNIGLYAFFYCTSLTSVTIPSSVTSIGNYAFYGCTSLNRINCKAENPPSLESSNVFDGSHYKNTALYVPSRSISKYKTTEPWSRFTIIKSAENEFYLWYIIDGEIYVSYLKKYQEPITPEPEPQKEGYSFSGWSEIPAIMPAHDVTVTGSFIPYNFKLTYIVDGVEYKTLSVPCGSFVTPEPAPLKEGYTFSGWTGLPATMPAHDVTVTGSFTINKYKLTYKVDGDVYKTFSVEYGTALTPIAAPTKEGYTFSGWSEIPATMPAHDVTVTGSFIVNKYKLTYLVDGAFYKSYEVDYASTITPEVAPAKEGHTFFRWSGLPETMPAHDVEVQALYNVNQYQLTYIIENKVYKSYKVYYNSVLMPEPEPIRKGMTFSGWANMPETMPAYDLTLRGTYSWSKETLDGVIYQVTDTLSNYASAIGYDDISGETIILPSIEIDGDAYNVNDISSSAFRNCTTLTSVSIPICVTSIGANAFYGCSNLASVTLESNAIVSASRTTSTSMKSIFGEQVKTYILGASINAIGSYAFYGCSGLTSITIPYGVTSIGSSAFAGMNIKKTIWLTNTPPSGYTNASGTINYVSNDQYTSLQNKVVYPFLSSMFEVNGIKYVPVSPSERTCDAIDCKYNEIVANTSIPSSVSYRGIAMNVQKVQPYLCYGNSFIETLHCENNGEISEYAFSGCTGITSLSLGEEVSSIGDYAFSGCSALSAIQIPQNVTTIGDYVFNGCTGLETVLMDDGEKELNLGCNGSNPLFASCPLNTVYIGRNISYPTSSNKGYSPFYRNTSLRSVHISDVETEVSPNEFYGCTNLKDVRLDDGITTIGDWAFSGCSSLDFFSFGSSVKSIGKEAFSDCTTMTKLYAMTQVPPTCGDQALDDISKWECTLIVPQGYVDAYRTAPQWKEFFFMDEVDPDGIKDIKNEELRMKNGEGDWYDLSGRKLDKPQNGINIIRYADGTSKKVLVK